MLSDGKRQPDDTLSLGSELGKSSPTKMGEMLDDDDLDQLCDKVIEELNEQTAAK